MCRTWTEHFLDRAVDAAWIMNSTTVWTFGRHAGVTLDGKANAASTCATNARAFSPPLALRVCTAHLARLVGRSVPVLAAPHTLPLVNAHVGLPVSPRPRPADFSSSISPFLAACRWFSWRRWEGFGTLPFYAHTPCRALRSATVCRFNRPAAAWFARAAFLAGHCDADRRYGG